MKNLIITSISILVIAALFIQPSIAQDHSEHHHKSENSERFEDVSEEFRSNLTQLVEVYLNGKDAFLKSDLETLISTFEIFKNKLEEIGQHGLSGEGHMSWMESYNQFTEHINTLINSENIGSARHTFRELSHEMAVAVKKFGVEGVVYHKYCPMALDSDGASWLSRNEQVENPYTPDTMLGCGELIEKIES